MAHGHALGMPTTTNSIVTTVYKSITIGCSRLVHVSAYTSKDLPPLKISGENPGMVGFHLQIKQK